MIKENQKAGAGKKGAAVPEEDDEDDDEDDDEEVCQKMNKILILHFMYR